MVNDRDTEQQALEDEDESEDDDYVPSASEGEDDGDVEGVVDSDSDVETEGKRRKKFKDVSSKKLAGDDVTKVMSPEEEKAKSDALWAELNADDKPVTKAATSASSSSFKKSTEEVVNDDKGPLATLKVATLPTVSGLAALRQASSGLKPKPATSRLSSLVAGFGKKNQPSTLLKTKADWDSYKSEAGISEELREHTKSKDSFVERQAFLQRTDVRQFEQEKAVRDRNRARQMK
ncbi:Craniofacial development protein 1 [Halotydeus destructor]|nr:Craniofacial development protein 1 [Halotydeus destructor]